MPGETEEQVKQVPVSLGSEAYEKLWPKMVYPSTLPGNVPLAVNVKMADLYASSEDDSGHQILHNDFQFPQEVNLFAAGTLGKHMSFFSELTYGELPDGSSEVEIEHARLDFVNAFGPGAPVQLPNRKTRAERLGRLPGNVDHDRQRNRYVLRLQPDRLQRRHRAVRERLLRRRHARQRAGDRDVRGRRHTDSSTSSASTVRSGPAGRTAPSEARLKRTSTPVSTTSSADWRSMETSTGVNLPPENWEETSFRVGALGYWGNGGGVNYEVTDPSGQRSTNRTPRSSGTASTARSTSDPRTSSAARSREKTSSSSSILDLGPLRHQAHGLQGLVRAGRLSCSFRPSRPPSATSSCFPADPTAPATKIITGNLSFLAYANMKLMLEYNGDPSNSKNYTISTLVRAAF